MKGLQIALNTACPRQELNLCTRFSRGRRRDGAPNRSSRPVSQRRERTEPRFGAGKYPPVKHHDLEIREVLGDSASQQLAHLSFATSTHRPEPARDSLDEERRQDARRGFTSEC